MSEKRKVKSSKGPEDNARMLVGEKPVNTKGALGKLIAYLAKYKRRLILMAVCAVVGTLFSVVAPKILGNATTAVFEGLNALAKGTGSLNFTRLARYLIFAMGLYLVSAVFAFLQGWVLTGISNDVGFQLRRQIVEKIDRLPMKYLEEGSRGDIQSRITNDVDMLQMGIASSFIQIITAMVTIIGVVVMMLTINLWMTLAVLVILPLSGVLIRFISKHSQIYFKGQLVHLGQVNGQIEENFSGQSVLRAYSQEEKAMAEFRKENELLYEAGWKAQFYSGLASPVTQFAGNIGYVVIAVLGGALVIKRAIAVGDIQAFLQYSKSFTQPIQQVAQIMNMLQSSIAAAERIFDFLETPEEASDPQYPEAVTHTKGAITFSQVSFGYDPGKTVIRQLTVEVSPGQKIAVVGPTGAGKSTLVKLLMRFYDVDSGAIEIDGHDIRGYRRADLRAMIGMVLQEVWLFGGTIMENIRYGRPEATDEEVIEAARAAHAHAFIMQQPDGYQTEVDEEAGNLSQGQKQLLTIARAVLADKKILILDEATSSVDTRTEILIQKAMDRLTEGRTSFVIAHRLSTIREADRILVMKDGDVIEQGTHEELLAQKGFYEMLYKSQFKESL